MSLLRVPGRGCQPLPVITMLLWVGHARLKLGMLLPQPPKT